jgi:hypothetical protein
MCPQLQVPGSPTHYVPILASFQRYLYSDPPLVSSLHSTYILPHAPVRLITVFFCFAFLVSVDRAEIPTDVLVDLRIVVYLHRIRQALYR